MKSQLFYFGLAVVLSGLSPSVQAEPLYSITTLGLTGAEYTDPSTGQTSSLIRQSNDINDIGQVIGYSRRYSESTANGISAWIYDSESNLTQRIGLIGNGYVKNDGYQYSIAHELNNFGQVVGYSRRYNDSIESGMSVWFYDSESNLTQRIGLTGGGYVRTDDYQFSVAKGINDIGQAVGYSQSFSGSTNNGLSTWIYNNESNITQQIGLVGSGYMRADGYQESLSFGLNNKGQVIGYSYRFKEGVSANQGLDSWIYDSESNLTQQIGLTGSGYVRTDGIRSSSPIAINDIGQVIGTSERINGYTSTGKSAWFYDSESNLTQRIGLTGSGYVRTDDYQYSDPKAINDLGQAIGASFRYNGNTQIGQAAWFYDSESNLTQRIGLTGSGYTKSDDFQFSTAAALNDMGQAIGTSNRYSGDTQIGQAAWLYDSESNLTQRIGLTDSGYTKSDGFQYSSVTALNDLGQVIGISSRYNGGTSLGQAAWFYDFSNQQIYDLTFSVRSSDSFAYTTPSFLAEDGTVLGVYSLYSPDDTSANHAFMWRMTGGFFDLGLLVEGGLDLNGWSVLYSTLNANIEGKILGSGYLMNGSTMPYLLTPTNGSTPTPEPATMLLMGAGLVGVLAARRRKS